MDNTMKVVLPAMIIPLVDSADKFSTIVSAIREEYLSSVQNYPWIVRRSFDTGN